MPESPKKAAKGAKAGQSAEEAFAAEPAFSLPEEDARNSEEPQHFGNFPGVYEAGGDSMGVRPTDLETAGGEAALDELPLSKSAPKPPPEPPLISDLDPSARVGKQVAGEKFPEQEGIAGEEPEPAEPPEEPEAEPAPPEPAPEPGPGPE